MYDLIGDIHGERATLEALLARLGYNCGVSGWSHPGRKAAFVGDFIDRGRDSAGVCRIVREMAESGAGLAVMGNHEINALAFHTRDTANRGEYLRQRNDRNTRQHQATLESFEGRENLLADTLDWFCTLPLWRDLGHLRLVHAAWHPESMQVLKPWLDEDNRLLPGSLAALHDAGSPSFEAMETLLKGPEVTLPGDATIRDKDGTERSEARIRWWLEDLERPWPEIVLGPPDMLDQLPDDIADASGGYGYDESLPPVFFGHYWLTGRPAPLAANVACLDYSVARPGGQLVAYRWDGESRLDPAHFTAVARRT